MNPVLAASRRAREALDGVVEGVPFPEELARTGGRTPLEVPYQVDGQTETLMLLPVITELESAE